MKGKKVKSWRYQRQLEFYSVLVEVSNDFPGKQVTEGRIEYFTTPSPDKDLTLVITPQAREHMKKLITATYNRLQAWDFPIVPEQPTLEDILASESDTIARYLPQS